MLPTDLSDISMCVIGESSDIHPIQSPDSNEKYHPWPNQLVSIQILSYT
jgi:hypothetical protein